MKPRTFHWTDCEEVLRDLAADASLEVDAKLRYFGSEERRVFPPLAVPIPEGCSSLASYLDGLPDELGQHLVIVMQAGAVSLAWFAGGEARATKSFKRYVVRGKGRAQPSHLEAKGKSRYGSRLRLQNARRLVEETNEKLAEWVADFGAPDGIYYSSPVRLWPSLFEGKAKPPFEKSDRLIRIPLDLPKPTSELVLRTYRALEHGRIEELG